MSLRAILGGGRVKKRSSSSKANRTSSSTSTTSASPSPSPLPRRKSSTKPKLRATANRDDDDYFDDKLDDCGLVRALATDLKLRDTPQAVQYIRSRMFTPVPESGGMSSTRIAQVLNYRRNLPPIVSVAHIQALLSSPSTVEREVAELVRKGTLRRITVPKRGWLGEVVCLDDEYRALLEGDKALSEGTKKAMLRFLEETEAGNLGEQDVEELLKAGYITQHHTGGMVTYGDMSGTMNTYARPQDKSSLTSLETVSRHAAGSLGTVGGQGAVHNAGGSGGRSGFGTAMAARTEYRIAAPGAGSYLKLISGAVEHLVSLLGKSKFKEAPETVLKERWDGGIASGEEGHAAAKRARGEFYGVLPAQTRKWRQFFGLSFEWVLQEAVGAGLVEVFQTGSVGRGVRAL
ncbi:serine-threonine protein kinase 19-domain-containing protein [Xylariaceae sp. FL1272]|nr:serine-threonine protein kinase 19-domain-containing protein [Xylariaceae sp. FL1272]